MVVTHEIRILYIYIRVRYYFSGERGGSQKVNSDRFFRQVTIVCVPHFLNVLGAPFFSCPSVYY
jgi:hypothetical protein